MKKVVSILVLVVMLFTFIGCGNSMWNEGIEYDTYGLFNKGDNHDPLIKYRVIVGNVVWSIILCETLIAPIYFIGFSLYEPVRPFNKFEKERLKERLNS